MMNLFASRKYLLLVMSLAVGTMISPTATKAASDTTECSVVSYCLVCVPCCTTTGVQQLTEDAFDTYRKDFIMDSFYTNTVEPGFQKVADQIRNAETFKTAAYGAFLDASTFMNSLRDLQAVTAKIMQTYTPSEQICRFGTLSRSLAASDARVDTNRLALSEDGLARSLGTTRGLGAAGTGQDIEYRLKLFVEQFCDLSDNNSGLTEVCQTATPVADLNHNRDIDYTRTLDDKPTINADFTDTNRTQEESDTIALAHFLYGHRLPSKRISYAEMDESEGSVSLYSEYRSVFARRAAAQNSYNFLAAMKAAGSGGSDSYMRAVLRQIGLSDADTYKYLGAQNTEYPFVNGSYYSQMEILTKRLYQDPSFYAGLMDSKANVRRTSASIQGIGLMQDRDTYRSMERSEMLLALLVQMEARKMVLNNQRPKGQ